VQDLPNLVFFGCRPVRQLLPADPALEVCHDLQFNHRLMSPSWGSGVVRRAGALHPAADRLFPQTQAAYREQLETFLAAEKVTPQPEFRRTPGASSITSCSNLRCLLNS
jgi:hypothetical protein